MADPVSLGLSATTLAGVGTGASVLGGITSAVGSIFGGQSKAGMYTYQAGVSRMNQQIAKQNADYSRYVGEVESQRSGMKSRFESGQALTTQAARGLDVNFGTPADVRESMHDLAVHDQATIRAGAARRAYGFEVEAEKQNQQANIYGRAARDAETAGELGAFSSILGTASSVASKWLDASRVGIGSGPGISLGPSPDFPYADQ